MSRISGAVLFCCAMAIFALALGAWAVSLAFILMMGVGVFVDEFGGKR